MRFSAGDRVRSANRLYDYKNDGVILEFQNSDIAVVDWGNGHDTESEFTAELTGLHFTADGFEVTEGGTYWDNNLKLVTVTRVASYSEENRNPDNGPLGAKTWWHDTTGGMADGSRLAKRHPFTGELAQSCPDHDPGCGTESCPEHPMHDGEHTYEMHHGARDHVDRNARPDPGACRCINR